MLTRLRNRLTLLYAGLFGIVLSGMAAILYITISAHAVDTAYEELRATTAVFERLENLRMAQMRDSAQIAARDFGFRAAVASRDRETIRSTLKNVRTRLNVSLVFMVSPDGVAISDEARPDASLSRAYLSNLQENGEADGATVLGAVAYRTSATPVYAPNLIGWLVVGAALDDAEMRALASLSAIKLKAELLVKPSVGGWLLTARSVEGARSTSMLSPTGLDGGVERGGKIIAREGQKSLAVSAPIASVDGAPVRLLLSYSFEAATAPFRTVLWLLFFCGVFGLAVMVVASWFLASSITRPLASLEAAAQKVEGGDFVRVNIEGADEIGRLARSFNMMIASIEERTQTVTHLALHDRETDLPNREHFERELRQLTEGQHYIGVIGVLRFAKIRDAIGYGLASALVSELAARFRAQSIAAGPARLSSDQIAIAFFANSDAAAEATLEKAQEAAGGVVELEGQQIDVVMIGGAAKLEPDIAESVERANIALDQARSQRRPAAAFDVFSYRDPRANLSLMGEMVAGLKAGDLYLAYQPKLNLRTGGIDGVEALVRWRHPRRGMIGPDLFVPMAEETGHIRALTDWGLDRAIADQAMFKRAGEILQVSVNISGRLVGDAAFTEHACALAERAEASLCFEITETAFMENPQKALEQLKAFDARGIAASIDDYGSGLSSLGYLRLLPAYELKMDRVFLSSGALDMREAFLLRSTIDLGHGLGMKVTAEGVEDAATLAVLTGLGCDFAQGYAIAKALEPERLLSFLRARRDVTEPTASREVS